MRIQSHHLRLAAYVLICVVGIFALWSVTTEADRRAEAICESNNDIRRVLIQLIDREGSPPTLPPEVDPEQVDPVLRALLEQSAESSERFHREAVELLALKNCERV